MGLADGWMVIYYVLYCHRRAAWEAQLICGWKWRCQVNVCSRDVISGYVNVTARLEFFLAGASMSGGRYAGVARVEKVLLGGSWFFLGAAKPSLFLRSARSVSADKLTDSTESPVGPFRQLLSSERKLEAKPRRGRGRGPCRTGFDWAPCFC